jgi:uncharacterized membrane protein (UPF0127 family)
MSRAISIINITQNIPAPFRLKYCDDFFNRLRGFTFRKAIGLEEGLVLVEKRDSKLDTTIHMLFVWTDLAVFWVDSSMVVVDKVLARSWRPYYASKFPARYVIELNPSQLSAFQIGDKLEFVND